MSHPLGQDYDPDSYRDLDARDRVDEFQPRCVIDGCNHLAPIGMYCGFHRGRDIADRTAGGVERLKTAQPRKPFRLLDMPRDGRHGVEP